MTNESFPGRWIEGAGLVGGPSLLLAGGLLRSESDGFFPSQLAAFAQNPTLMTASYSVFAAGLVLLVPATLALTRRIGATHARLARWGGALVLAGLLARIFHHGVNHLAMQLVNVQGQAAALRAVSEQYSSFHLFQLFNVATFLGWIVLAVAAWRSQVLGVVGSVGLALMTSLPLGVLKGTGPMSIVAAAGLCAALLPLGVKVLRQGPAPRWWAYPVVAAAGAALGYLGLMG
ncbi:hypothetical protein [Nonomuraea typhae]|uniref:hypothetical protein n=1 Tax=Nonomuraea typhae TaxID=2603600 RepID=UPI0012F725DF|nr:hypothetical protein [Nonomuraea typhae]